MNFTHKFLIVFVALLCLLHDSSSLQIELQRSKTLFESDNQVAQQLSDLMMLNERFRMGTSNFSDMNLLAYLDDSFYGVVRMGTPLVAHYMLFDTVRSETWIASGRCKKSTHKESLHNYYNHSASSTYRRDRRPFEVTYGSPNSSVYGRTEGNLASEVFELNGFEIVDFVFGEARHFEGDFFGNSEWDGAVGLGPAANSKHGIPSLIDELLDQHENLEHSLRGFTLYFYPQNDSLYPVGGLFNVGQIEDSKWKSNRNASNYEGSSKMWQITIRTLELNKQNLCGPGCTGIIDTTYKYIAGPASHINAITNSMGSKAFGNLRIVSCDEIHALPTIEMNIEYTPFNFTGSDYTIRIYADKVNMCVSGFRLDHPYSSAGDQKTYVMGIVFVKRFYSIFNIGSDPPRVQLLEPDYSLHDQEEK